MLAGTVKPHSPQCFRNAGFSLIEILVALCVIAILAMTISSVTTHLRGHSESIAITSQMRQIAQAVFLYSSENNDKLPGPLYSGQGFRFKNERPQFLLSSIGVYLGQKQPGSQWDVANRGFMTAAQSEFITQTNVDSVFYRIEVSGSTIPFGYADSAIQPLYRSQIPEPNNLFMLREVDQLAVWVYPSNGWYPRAPARPLHGNNRHAVYFDGRVEAMPRAQTERQ